MSRILSFFLVFSAGVATGLALHQLQALKAYFNPTDSAVTAPGVTGTESNATPDLPAGIGHTEQRSPRQIKTELEQQLKIDKNNPALYRKMALILVAEKQVEEALVWFVDAKQLSESQSEFDAIEKQIEQTIDTFTMAHQQTPDKVTDFLNLLIQLDPNTDRWYFKKAQWLVRQKQFNAASTLLDRLRYHGEFAEPARDLSQTIEQQIKSAQTPTRIKLDAIGHHYVVEVLVASERLKLLVDTGATLTTFSAESAYALQLDQHPVNQPDILIETAGGPVESTTYLLPEFSLGPDDTAVENLEIAIIPMTLPSGVSGLLGMNYLKNFKFQIDHKQKLLLFHH